MAGARTALGTTGAMLVLLVPGVPAGAAAEQRISPHRAQAIEAGGVPGARRAPSGAPERAIELGVSHPNRLQRRKANLARAGRPRAAKESTGPAPAAGVVGSLNRFGLVADGDAVPPDSTGAIGPTDYVETVNNGFGSIGVFDRADLGLEASTTLNEFVGVPSTPDDGVFDPQIQWDPVSGRWLYVTDYIDQSTNPDDNFLAFGWSIDDGDPDPLPFGPSGWCQFFINRVPAEFEDYPKLGHNDNHIIIGTNVFDGNDFLTSRIWAIPKPAAGDDSCAAPTGFFFGTAGTPLETDPGVDAFTPVPANTFEASANGFVVAAEDTFAVATPNEITAWHVSGPAGAPTLTEDGDASVGIFDVPANVPQPGTIQRLDSLDARLTQAVARTDPAAGDLALWTQHTVDGAGGRSVVDWYELAPDAPSVIQRGTVSNASHFVFNGAISPNSGGGSAVLNYNVGSSSLLPQIRTRFRFGSTALDQMVGEATIGTSVAPAQDFSCDIFLGEPCRWGDYAGASPDPADASLVWGSNQVLGPANGDAAAWRTRNFAFSLNPPDTSIDSGPSQGSTITDSTPSFGFSSNQQGAGFQCRVDGAAFSSCTSPAAVGPLTNSAHTFQVRAVDPAGNADPTPASRGFTVDAAGPTAVITDGPKKKVKTRKNRAKAEFEFAATDTAASAHAAGASQFSFECRLDNGEFEPCTSPHQVKVRAKRKFKQHSFGVRATNEVDVTGPEAERKWRVKRKRKR